MNRLLYLAPIVAFGCNGPLSTPMVQRLDDERQAQVDEAWGNILTPPRRLDRSTLLDVVIMNQLHCYGVDRLDMVSEKDVPDGTIVMAVHFDRANPDGDAFSIALVDPFGDEWWREDYSQHEVEEHVEFVKALMSWTPHCDALADDRWRPQTPPPIPDSDNQPRTWHEWCDVVQARLKVMAEVTAPVTEGTPAAIQSEGNSPPSSGAVKPAAPNPARPE